MPRVPGTRVSLDPPPGFQPANGFAGWAQPDREAAIAVTEVPTPREVMISQLTVERLAGSGTTVLAARREGTSWWVHAQETPWTGPVDRWMVVLGDDHATALVIATIPSGDPALAAQIEAALRTAKYDAGVVASPFEGLRFEVTEQGGLKLAARSHGLVVLTEGGNLGAPLGAPVLTVGGYDAPGLPDDWYAFATGHLKDLAQVTALGDVAGEPVTLPDGALAYEIVTDGLAVTDGRAMAVYQLASARDGTRTIVSALVAHDASERWIPVFRAVGRSLRAR